MYGNVKVQISQQLLRLIILGTNKPILECHKGKISRFWDIFVVTGPMSKNKIVHLMEWKLIWCQVSISLVPKTENGLNQLTLQWRHKGHDGVSNHQPHHCLLNLLFRVQIKENSKAPCHWPLGTGKFPAQMASNAENVSIWWRHHDLLKRYDPDRIYLNFDKLEWYLRERSPP